MTKTYSQIQKQIEVLTREAEKARQKELEGVVARIRESMEAYGLTPRDLGFNPARGARAGGAAAKKSRRGGRASAKSAARVKYRDEAGHVWGGRGPRPQWLREALSSGKELTDFQV